MKTFAYRRTKTITLYGIDDSESFVTSIIIIILLIREWYKSPDTFEILQMLLNAHKQFQQFCLNYRVFKETLVYLVFTFKIFNF